MGNPTADGAPGGAANVHTFYSAGSWVEGSAIDQLQQVAALPGVRQVAAFPDLHPGKYGPVGCAVLADRIFPHLIGNDIGCGMSLFALDLPTRKLRTDKCAERLRTLEGVWDGDAEGRLASAGIHPGHNHLTLGTIGGGNHFCEVQTLQTGPNGDIGCDTGLSKDTIYLLVHSGSRSFGAQVFDTVRQFNAGIDPDSAVARRYLEDHQLAVAWARLNRLIIAERAAAALRASCELIADSPHNLIEAQDGGFLHRKGAAKADIPLVPLAGSRDALSYLVKPTSRHGASLLSIAHGSGRKYDRRSMSGRVGGSKSDRSKLRRTSFGGHVICEDRQLLIEEAPGAYKDSRQVLDDLMGAGLVECVAALKPVITFKKAAADQATERSEKRARLLERRRDR